MGENRTKSAVITLIIGLALNIALGASKLTVGLIASSASVISDAANNISDAAVSVATIIVMRLAVRGADHEHPYGHGRYEYIATFVIGAVIVAVGLETLMGGIERIITPVAVKFGAAFWATLGIAIGIKSVMAVMYFVRARQTGSDTLKAAAVDSVSDAAVTSVVLACALAEKFSGVKIDGYATIAVSVVILVFAVRILRSTISRLIGERPDPQLYDRIVGIITDAPHVLSVHDIIINDYGEHNKIVEADAVFPKELSFAEVHGVCDGIERRARDEIGVRLCLHADPYEGDDDSRRSEIKSRIESALGAFGVTAHDIKIDDENSTVELDIKLSGDADEGVAVEQARALCRSVVPYEATIHVDYI